MLYFTLCDIIHPTTEVLNNELKSSQNKNDFPINFWFLILAHYFFLRVCLFFFSCLHFELSGRKLFLFNALRRNQWGGGEQGESGGGHGPSIFEQKKGPTVSVSNIGDIAFHGSNF